MLSEQILRSVGSPDAKLTAKLYDKMLSSEAIRDLAFMKLKPTPAAVLEHKEYSGLAKALGREITIDESDDEYSVSPTGRMSIGRYRVNENKYLEIRNELLGVLNEAKVDASEFIKKAEKA